MPYSARYGHVSAQTVEDLSLVDKSGRPGELDNLCAKGDMGPMCEG